MALHNFFPCNFLKALVSDSTGRDQKNAQTTSHTAAHSLGPRLLNSTRGQTWKRAPGFIYFLYLPPAILGGRGRKKLGVAGANCKERGLNVEGRRGEKKGAAVVKEGGMTWGQQMVREGQESGVWGGQEGVIRQAAAGIRRYRTEVPRSGARLCHPRLPSWF